MVSSTRTGTNAIIELWVLVSLRGSCLTCERCTCPSGSWAATVLRDQTVLQLVLYAERLQGDRLIQRTRVSLQVWMRQSRFCGQPVHGIKGEDTLQEINGWNVDSVNNAVEHHSITCVKTMLAYLGLPPLAIVFRSDLLNLPPLTYKTGHDLQQFLSVLLSNNRHSVQNQLHLLQFMSTLKRIKQRGVTTLAVTLSLIKKRMIFLTLILLHVLMLWQYCMNNNHVLWNWNRNRLICQFSTSVFYFTTYSH